MNTPAQFTMEHRKLALEIRKIADSGGHLDAAAQLIADSEARAVTVAIKEIEDGRIQRLSNARQFEKQERARAEIERDALCAELAKERLRLGWLLNWNVAGHPFKSVADIDAAIDAAKKETTP